MSDTPPVIRETSDELREAGDRLASRIEIFADRIDDAAARAVRRLRLAEDVAIDARQGMERPARRLARAMTDFVGEARRSLDRIASGRRRHWWQRIG